MILRQVLPEVKYLITLRLLINKNRQKGGSIKWKKKRKVGLANLTSKFKKTASVSLRKLSPGSSSFGTQPLL